MRDALILMFVAATPCVAACGAMGDVGATEGPSHTTGASGAIGSGGRTSSSSGSGGSSSGQGGSSVSSGAGGSDVADASLDTGGSGGFPDDARSGDDGPSIGDVAIGPPDTGRVDGGAFVHPGILSTKFELDYMKQQVAAGMQPWKMAFDKLKGSSAGSLTYTPHPRAEIACGSSGQPDLGCSDETRDSEAVYAQALLWYASGDVRYAQKCADILNAYSAVVKSHGMSNAPLQIGWTGGGFVRAAEILRYSYPQWDKAHIDQFSAMMNTAYLPLIENFNKYSTNGNWDDVMIEVMISIAVFDDNQALFDKAVARYKKRLPAYIYASADGPKPLLPDPTATQNLVTFWYGQTTYMDGLCQETCRDLRHVQHGFGGLIHTAEIAWHQGVDLYSERDNRLMAGLEFHAQYILGAKVPSNLCTGTLMSTEPMPSWEIPYNHYHNRKKLSLPESERIVNMFAPEGAVQHMMYGTLTHHGVGALE